MTAIVEPGQTFTLTTTMKKRNSQKEKKEFLADHMPGIMIGEA